MITKKVVAAIVLLAVFGLPPVAAQQAAFPWDQSGNELLTGRHRFRAVTYVTLDTFGNLDRALALDGTIDFDGQGRYTLQARLLDSDRGSAQNYSASGTYAVAASGFGFISSPISNGDTIYGLVSRGIFIGSSTESAFNDLFIAGPAAPATNDSFRGLYTLAYLNVPASDPSLVRNGLFALNADGQGGFTGGLSATGYVGGSGNAVVTQTIEGARYGFDQGVGTLFLPDRALTNQTLVAGNKVFYLSPDGEFAFGGSTNTWDMLVAVRSSETLPSDVFGGLYYQAGLNEDVSRLARGVAGLDSYYGAFNAISGGLILGHQRITSPLVNNSYDYTYRDSYVLNADGSYDAPDQSHRYVVGSGGSVRIGGGIGPYLGISVAVRAPAFSGSGVFLNPAGVLNAASSAPFTNGVARGELVTLYGTNLAPAPEIAAGIPFPTSLNGVQVMINNRPPALYSVAPTQISAIIPYATEPPIVQIQINNNGTQSNTVTAFLSVTAPGVFTMPPGGPGYAAALHSDFSLVSPENPARPGETIAIFLTGLGEVAPSIPEGGAGPSNPASIVRNAVGVSIDGLPAVITYAGLAPTLAGLYQVNATLASGVRSGDVLLTISGPDAVTSEALLPVGAGSGTNSAGAVLSRRVRHYKRMLMGYAEE